MNAYFQSPRADLVGHSVADLDTPCLVVDLDALDRNIGRLAEFFRSRRVNWRPHTKSYKCVEMAQRVLAAGAIGVTCAKLGEAETLGLAGIRDILITGPVVGATKLARLCDLRRIADPLVVIDHVDHVAMLADAANRAGVRLRALLEIDLGMNRCGVLPGAAAVELARHVAAQPSLELAGIMGWEGHLLTLADLDEKRAKLAAALQGLSDTRSALESAGLPCPIVSAGGTGSFQQMADLGVATEIEAGGAVFMDLFYRRRCHVEGLEFALKLIATVVSRPAVNRAVIDAGRKATNPELHLPEVRDRDDLKVSWLSAEHGVLEVVAGPGPRIGERLELTPGYGDWTTCLHDRLYVAQAGRVVDVWELAARGRSD